MAGIVCLQHEGSNYVFGITRIGDDYVLLLERNQSKRVGGDLNTEIVASVKIDVRKPISLKVQAEGDEYQFSYASDGAEFTNLGGKVSGDILSTNVAGGFTGALIGLYATSGNTSLPVE
jgi:alpha-N-arabinofuranosidase